MSGGISYKLVHGFLHGIRPMDFRNISISYRSKTGGNILQVGPDPLNHFFLVSVYKKQACFALNIVVLVSTLAIY